MRVLVTGATGYIGGRLIPRLLEEGHQVRILVRDRTRVRGRAWHDSVEVREGDLHDPASLVGLCDDVDAAYYLVHSMDAGADFAQRDLEAAGNFVSAASTVAHVVYLGGLLPPGSGVSEHLRSRADVGRVLRGGTPHHRVSRRPDHRLRLCLLRDDPLPDRAAPGDGGAPLDPEPGAELRSNATSVAAASILSWCIIIVKVFDSIA